MPIASAVCKRRASDERPRTEAGNEVFTPPGLDVNPVSRTRKRYRRPHRQNSREAGEQQQRGNARTCGGLMVGFRRCLKAAAAGMLVVTVAVTVLEMEVFYSLRGGNNGTGVRLQRSADIMINPAARLPNEGRLKRENGGKSRCAGDARTRTLRLTKPMPDESIRDDM